MERTQGLSAKEYDKKLDDLVDGGITYDMARRQLGRPPYEIDEVDSNPAVSVALGKAAVHKTGHRRRRNGNGPQFGEDVVVGYPNGQQPCDQRDYKPLTPEEVARIHRGTAEVNKVLAAARYNREHKGVSDE